ncbi:hypothetical protein [Pseudomonas sp. Leaf58]|uniref:hypothetical protein n=1 Tax=Pseudomonas sp. Leaf58 TaxID=1736226 RepID=UPI0012E750D3|nr:hypothetical protein [Pseudomonas sp. Leaf58]
MFFSAGLLLIIVQQPENQKTTRAFVELTDSAESFFWIVTELPAQTNCRPARQGDGLPQWQIVTPKTKTPGHVHDRGPWITPQASRSEYRQDYCC